MVGYEQRVRETLAWFCKPGDELECVDYFLRDDQTCELCGKQPISHNFVIRNPRTGGSLRVGSTCITQYKLYTGRRVVFPESLYYEATRFPSFDRDDVDVRPDDAARPEPEHEPLACDCAMGYTHCPECDNDCCPAYLEGCTCEDFTGPGDEEDE